PARPILSSSGSSPSTIPPPPTECAFEPWRLSTRKPWGWRMTTTWPPRWPPATRRWPLGPTVGLRQSLVGCSCPLLSRGEAPGTLEEGCLRKPTRGLEPRTPSLRAAAAVRGALRLLYAMRVAIGDHRVPRSERLPLSMGVVLPPRCHLTRAGTGLEASGDGRKKEGTWGAPPMFT